MEIKWKGMEGNSNISLGCFQVVVVVGESSAAMAYI